MSEANLNVLPPMMFDGDVTLVPIVDNVVIQPEAHDRVTTSGLILPSADRTRPLVGRVVSAGEGRLTKERVLLPMPVKVGDRVIYHRYEGTEIKAGEKPALLILEIDDILAIVKDVVKCCKKCEIKPGGVIETNDKRHCANCGRDLLR